jgi:hypothetical protein
VLMGCTRLRGVSIILKGPQFEVEQPEPRAQEGSSIANTTRSWRDRDENREEER